MLDPKMIAEFEQSVEATAEMLEGLHKSLTERFGDPRAWELVKVIAFAMFGGKGTT